MNSSPSLTPLSSFPRRRESKAAHAPPPRDFNEGVPEPAGLLAYIERRQGTTKLRTDDKLVINRAWASPEAQLNRLVQLTNGLSAIALRGEKRPT